MKVPRNNKKSKNVEDRRNEVPTMLFNEFSRILKETGFTGFQGIPKELKALLASREQAKKFDLASKYYLAKTGVQPDAAKLFGMLMQQPNFGPSGPAPRASAQTSPDTMYGPFSEDIWQSQVDLGPEYGMLSLEEARQATNKGPAKRPVRSRKVKK